jgi:hypothetical protein
MKIAVVYTLQTSRSRSHSLITACRDLPDHFTGAINSVTLRLIMPHHTLSRHKIVHIDNIVNPSWVNSEAPPHPAMNAPFAGEKDCWFGRGRDGEIVLAGWSAVHIPWNLASPFLALVTLRYLVTVLRNLSVEVQEKDLAHVSKLSGQGQNWSSPHQYLSF